jgi:hypothetical protein
MEISLRAIRRMSDGAIQSAVEIQRRYFARHKPVYGMEGNLARLEDLLVHICQ